MTTHTFTDAQGTTHTDAILQVISANLNFNGNDGYSYNLETGEVSINDYNNININYTMGYWKTQEDKDAGRPPYLYNKLDGGQMTGNLYGNSLAEADYGALTAVQAAEKHFIEVETA